jgi:PadR family transcriptional regulator, regulatory protein PadR
MGRDSKGGELVQGTLDMLILNTLARGAMHGWGIARHIQQVSDDVLRVEEGSLYPALRRLELDGFVTAEWAASENNRRARYYALTARGRKQLIRESKDWSGLVRAISSVMRSA